MKTEVAGSSEMLTSIY